MRRSTSTLSMTASKILARPVALPDEDLHDHALLVLAGLVAQADRCGLPPAAQLVGDDR
jgi:hypothetical protein